MKTDYREIVKHSLKDMVSTDYLTTALCFVPKSQIGTFTANYGMASEGWILPESLKRLDADNDDKIALYRVVVMRHAFEEFSTNCKKNLKIQVIQYNEAAIKDLDQKKNTKEKINTELDQKKAQLLLNSKNSFCEAFYGLMHLKLLRLFVESALKYDTEPVSAAIISPRAGYETSVITALIKHFSDVGAFLNRRRQLVRD